MMYIATVDDDNVIRKMIIESIQYFFRYEDIEYRIFEYSSISKFKDENRKFDIVFLDIELKDGNGVDLAKELYLNNIGSVIVFVTSHDSYIKNSFGLNVYGYILKEELQEKIPTVLRYFIKEVYQPKMIVFTTEEGVEKFNKTDILYFFIENRKIYLCDKNKKVQIHISSLKKTFEKLDDNFISPNNQCILNLKYIKKITNDFIYLENGEKVSVSFRKLKKIKNSYKKYLLELVKK